MLRGKLYQVLVHLRQASIEAADLAAVNEERRSGGYVDGLAERNRGIDVRLRLGLGGAGRDVGALNSGSIGESG